MMKNILITGGAGFIGSNLALELLNKGYNVTVLDSLSPQVHGCNPNQSSPLYRNIKDKVRFIQGSVTHKEDWQKVLPDQDAVIHLAAETGTGQSMYEVEKYTEVNIAGTSLMLDLLVNGNYKVKKVVVASSRSIYGEGKYRHPELGIVYPDHRKDERMQQGDFEVKYHDDQLLEVLPTCEESKIHPSSVYGITKQTQEQLVMTVCPTVGIAGVSLRYQNVYGPGQSLTNPYTGILSIFSTRIKNGNAINIFEDGKESRDFVYIDDAVEATLLGLEKVEANNNVFNVGAGVATNIRCVAEMLCENFGLQVPIDTSGNYRMGDIRHNFADLSKINSKLGFIPKVSFEKGIKQFTDWVLEQEIHEDKLSYSLEEMKKKGLYK
ncbi:NAD-dependent epimerase/dehydratase family protein [Chryseobacterium gotjawalense]|uniref:NAD-dependent epimerase/dehydratase family protein n=1 Tax=Chryseobacterium gotjawalense TaxID=3042315 RepID=A0ABY8RH20_9FLAO|nr:NAD-dependent epimerase/dehydratase family protein [Chryseobacterium sp. wdc7]WHF53044.1 NAD-dependent epimerase/dehydratase family protein [Chryseobacterium sp. wdc7]